MMNKTTQLQNHDKDKAKKLLALALTETLETPTSDGTIDLPGYKILDTLGRGGMGTVYRAVHVDLGRTVALKIFTPQGKDYDLFVERLKREGQLMAQLEHPNVLGIYDAAVMEDGTPYLVLEYVKGEDLYKRLQREGKLSQRTAVRIAIKVCDALSAVHELGIVHRDIKPANVLLGQDGSVKVMDFGISKDVTSQQQYTSLTMTGTTVGTADYMSPEQTRNEELSARSDLYSVGVLLYEMLMGVTPRGKFDSLSKAGVPKKLEQLIMRCLQRDRSKRPASAATLAHSLRKVYAEITKRKRTGVKEFLGYSLFALSLIALVLYLALHDTSVHQGAKKAGLPAAVLGQSPAIVGVWKADDSIFTVNNDGSFTLRDMDGKTPAVHGRWDSARDGGYYLRWSPTGESENQPSIIQYARVSSNALVVNIKGERKKFIKNTQH